MAWFAYGRFWTWVQTAAPPVAVPTDDIIVHVCSADYTAMRANRVTRAASPFLTRNMAAFRVMDAELLGDGDVAYGMYFVMERVALPSWQAPGGEAMPSAVLEQQQALRARENALRAKRLYVVIPTLHEHGAVDGGRLLSGDHWSFVINSGGGRSTTTPLHLHLTQYVPWRAGLGNRLQVNNYLPLEFIIPGTLPAFKEALLQPALRFDDIASPLHRLLRRPFVAEDAATSSGGAALPRPGRGRAARHVANRTASNAPRAFDDMWFELPLHRLVIVGVRRGAGYDFTVTIHDRLAHAPGMLRRAASFQLRAAQARDRAAVFAACARAMADLTWDAFVDAPEWPE